jgi:hypothetical protein
MSSGGKSSAGANASQDYYGTVFGIGGVGPIKGIEAVLVDGVEQYGINTLDSSNNPAPSGPLVYGVGGVGEPYDLAIPTLGTITIHWGVPSQMADATLNAYADNPPYRPFWGATLKDCLFGTERQTPPNIEIIPLSDPAQTIVTGTPAVCDANGQANSAAFAAELATGWHGLQLTAGQINIPSFQAVANDLATDAFLSQLSPCSPYLKDQKDARSNFGDLMSLADTWFRFDLTGKLEMGRWLRTGPIGSVTVITANEWTTPPKDASNDLTKIPTGFDVVFCDRTQLYQETTQPVNNLTAIRMGAISQRQQLQRDFITSQAQAQLHGQEAVRLQGVPTITGSVVVRATQARNPDGTPIRQGDYFELDINQEPGATALLQLCRCTGRTFDPEGPITLEYEYDPSGTPAPFVVTYSNSLPPANVVGPISYQRIIALQPKVGEEPYVCVLGIRSNQLWSGFQIYFDTNISGDYTAIGNQNGFALMTGLVNPVATSDTVIRVSIPATFAGQPSNLDSPWLTAAVGVNADSAAQNDTLLLILIRKNPSTGQQYMNGTLPWLEVCSILDVAIVSSSTYDVTVLRSRLGTNVLAFDTAGGTISFPDALANYEGWVIPRSLLFQFTHGDFASLFASAGSGFFEFAPFTAKAVYNPASAYAAGLQGSPAWTPIWEYIFPSGFTDPVINLVPPAAPGAVTFVSGSVYQGGDGTVISSMTFSMPAIPTGAFNQWLVYRATGESLWMPGPKDNNTSAVNVSISGLITGQAYDVGIQAENSSGVLSAVTLGMGSPFTAPSKTAAPATPTGLTSVIPGGPMVALSWTANSEDDIADYGVYRSTAGGAGPWTQIGKTASTSFHDTGQVGGITVGTQYWYAITAINSSANESAKTTAITATPLGVAANNTPPQNPGAVTISGSGGFALSNDGNVYSALDFNVPAMPVAATGFLAAAYQNLLFRVTGTTNQWQPGNANLTNTAAVVARIDRLSPGVGYDVALQAFTAFGAPSAIVVATGSPFTAPVKSTAPTAPTGLSMRAAIPSDGIAGNFDSSGFGGPGSSQLLPCGILTWTPPTETDIVAVQFATSTSSGPTLPSTIGNFNSPITAVGYSQTIYGKQPPFLAIFNGSFGFIPVNTVYLRYFDSSGNPSAWSSVSFAYGTAYAGDLASQNASATQLQSMIVAPASASGAVAFTNIFPVNYTITTVGGAQFEEHMIPLTGAGFTAQPDGGFFVAAGFFAYDAQHNYYNGSNNSSQASVVLKAFSGTITAGQTVQIRGFFYQI